MPRRYFSKVPSQDMPSTTQMLVVLSLMFGMALLIIILHPEG